MNRPDQLDALCAVLGTLAAVLMVIAYLAR